MAPIVGSHAGSLTARRSLLPGLSTCVASRSFDGVSEKQPFKWSQENHEPSEKIRIYRGNNIFDVLHRLWRWRRKQQPTTTADIHRNIHFNRRQPRSAVRAGKSRRHSVRPRDYAHTHRIRFRRIVQQFSYDGQGYIPIYREWKHHDRSRFREIQFR